MFGVVMNETAIVERITELKRLHPAITWEEIQRQLEAECAMRWNSPMALRAWWRRRKDRVHFTHTQRDADATVAQRTQLRDAAMRDAAMRETRESDLVRIPEPLPKPFHEPLRIPFQRTLVIADVHAPFHDKSFLVQLLTKHRGEYDQIVVAGDVFDFAQISRFPRDWNVPRLETELAMAGEVLLALAKTAPVYICNGNHDERVAVKLDAALTLQRLIYAALGQKQPRYQITVSEYDYIEIGETFVIGHLSQSHKQPGKLAATIAKQRQRHVLVGHDHLLGVVQNDQWLGASIGCIADPQKFWYSERRLNTYAPMQQGYALLRAEDEFDVFNRFSEPVFRRYRYLGNMYNSWKG